MEPNGPIHTSHSIYHLIKAHAERIPDAIAIAAPGRIPLTYSRLFTHVENTVETLNAMGIGRNDRVAIVLPNGPETAVAFLTLAASATCAPLNPAYQANEFDFYLSDLNAKALIVQSGLDCPAVPVARKHAIPVLELLPLPKAEAGIFAVRGDEQPFSTQDGFAQPDDLALVLYTSGTTSRPKRVPLTHSNLLASARNIAASLQLTEEDRCLNIMPLFHIHGVIGAILSSLMAGSSVVCTPGFDTKKCFAWLEAFRPTWYTAVPTMHQAVLSCAPANSEMLRHCSLRFIRSSSAPLSLRLMQRLEEVFHVPVIEAYGMTEASHQIASNPLPPRQRKPGSVGLAAGPEVAIMDEAGNFLRAGGTGEIVIRGVNVTPGYENNPLENERAFAGGWFRTGDQGYLDSEGYLFITGRLKEFINRGGEKVSAREIEAALVGHPEIYEAVAFAVPHPSRGEDIAAAVVLRDKTRVTEPMIRDYLFERLADFKIPSRVLIVDEIPKGATGKVRRIGLAEKFARQLKGQFVEPKSDLETMIASIYAEVLGIERISTADNFFALGGDSLRATQVISRVRAALQVDLPIATLFKKATVAELADEITRSAEATDRTVQAEILTELKTVSEEDAQRLLAAKVDRHPSSIVKEKRKLP